LIDLFLFGVESQKRKELKAMSEAFEKWIGSLKQEDIPSNGKGIARIGWNAALAEVEKMIAGRMENSGDNDSAYWERAEDFDILASIRAMKEGKG
jgi:hypothetical protein